MIHVMFNYQKKKVIVGSNVLLKYYMVFKFF